MKDSEAKEFIYEKMENYIKWGFDEERAERLAYCDLEEYLTKHNLKIEE